MTDGTVLLAMDFQNGIAGGLAEAPIMDRVREALAHARETGIPVGWVRVALRPGYPELPETSPFQRIAALGDLSEDSDSTQILEVLGRKEDEPLVTKRRVGAFSGSDLATVLAGLGATNLVLTGVATRGVVLATWRQAADLDFGVTVLSDACADPDPEVHRVLTEEVFPWQSDVLTVAEWTGK